MFLTTRGVSIPSQDLCMCHQLPNQPLVTLGSRSDLFSHSWLGLETPEMAAYVMRTGGEGRWKLRSHRSEKATNARESKKSVIGSRSMFLQPHVHRASLLERSEIMVYCTSSNVEIKCRRMTLFRPLHPFHFLLIHLISRGRGPQLHMLR